MSDAWKYPVDRPRATKIVNFRVPEEMCRRIDKAARQRGLFRSDFLREAVVAAVESSEAAKK